MMKVKNMGWLFLDDVFKEILVRGLEVVYVYEEVCIFGI